MRRTNSTLFVLVALLLIAIILLLWIGLNAGTMRATLASVNTQTAVIELSTIAVIQQPMNPTVTPTITLTPTWTQTPTATYTSTPTATPPYESTEIIGVSVEGRPLDVHRFGTGEHAYMIVAGIHGGYEWNTVSLADELIEELRADPSLVPQNRTLYLLRVLNPDGYAKDDGPDGRANANNVDINRNWDANWQANWYGAHCWNYRFITAGSEPGSEPETKALAKFLVERKVEALISYHSAALGIFAGGWPNDKNSLNLAYSLSLVSPYSYPPVSSDCAYTGQLIDWASAQGIAAVDVELTNHVDTDLAINLRILDAFLRWEPIE